MWKNKWDMNTWPRNYLYDLAISRQPAAEVSGNGRKDFMAIDWIEAARQFEKWYVHGCVPIRA